MMYAICLNRLLRIFEDKLPGIMIWQRPRSVAVLAYADDVPIFVTSPADFPVIQDALRRYERAPGECLNPQKSTVLTIAGWSETDHPGHQISTYGKNLGVTFRGTIQQSMIESWEQVTRRVRMQAKTACARELCLGHQLRYVHACLLAMIWYTAQIFPAPRACTQQLTTAIT